MTNILDYLEQSAKKVPDKTAFADPEKEYTYSQLKIAARKAGTKIAEYAVPESPVPVFADKSADAVAAFMGIVYAGCCYSMIEPKQPASRIHQILEVLDAKVLVADETFSQELAEAGFTGKVLWYQELFEGQADEEKLKKVRDGHIDTRPLYINFTSGSTGVPKGVVVSHRSVIDFIGQFTELFHITEDDVIGNQAPFDFDVSVKDIYSTLYTGATMQIIPKKYFSFPTKLLDYLCEREVTTLIWAVSALCILTKLKAFSYKVPEKVNKVIFSGEVMPVKHLNLWREQLPDAMYVNVYGPTEITCNCTYYIVDREFTPEETIPVGRPFPNEKVILLDEENELVTEPGKNGEICVSGTALSLGYYRSFGQTKKAFVQNPLNDRYIEMIYRTGDLGYYGEDGLLYFRGRKDFQIKHMGHRIELGEIEMAMDRIEEISRVCCIFDEKRNKIIAFYEGGIEKTNIVRILGQSLPSFMIPNIFCQVENMPLTDHGKIDRKALKREYMEVK